MKTKLNVSIKQLKLITNWEFDSPVKECTLCKCLLSAPSPQELNVSKSKGYIDGEIVLGDCGHMFHKDCMDSFVKSGCTSCPTDVTPWKTVKTIKSGVIFGNQQLAVKTKTATK